MDETKEVEVPVPKGEAVSSSSLPRMTEVKVPDGTPWWAKLMLQGVSMVGIPAAICAFLLYERYTILKDFSATTQATKTVVERVVPVLERLERRLGP